MLDALQFEFMRHALAAGLLASIICGIMGTLVVANRIVFLSGGIAHAAYGGIGMAFYFGWPYLAGTVGFSLAAAMVMAAVTLRARHRADTIIGVVWAVGMAVGIILLDLTPGYNVDLMSYLFGSILTVPASDLWVMLGTGVAVAGFVAVFYQDLLTLSYDEEFARIRGVPVHALYFSLIGLLAVAIVMVIQVVGLILVIALLTLPAAIASQHATTLGRIMLVAVLLGALFTSGGLALSYGPDLPAGATIILLAGVTYLASTVLQRTLQRWRARRPAAET